MRNIFCKTKNISLFLQLFVTAFLLQGTCVSSAELSLEDRPSGKANAVSITLTNPQRISPSEYDQPPRLAMGAAEQQEFDQAMARSHREGPISLPRAAQSSNEKSAGAATISNYQSRGAKDFNISSISLPSGPLANFSAVMEPSGDNAGKYRFQAGNWYAAKSTNGGTTWTYLNPFSVFGQGFCCDQVVTYDEGRNAWFWLLQYTDGTLKLAVSTNDLQSWCAYTISPSTTGFSGQIDYNDLVLTTNYIHVVSNYFPSGGGQGSQIIRMPLDQLSSCSSWSGSSFRRSDLGFTWKAVSGAYDVLYWGTNWYGTLGKSFRVFKWPENSNDVTWYDRTLNTTFAFFTRNSGQNCASNNGNVKNWCQFADSRVLGGARYTDPSGNSLLVFSFNAKQGGPFNLPWPYTERVYFKESDLSYFKSDRQFANDTAYQFMSMATDARGHVGMTSLYGGGTRDSGNRYVSGLVALQDDIAPNQPWSYATNALGSGNVCKRSNDGLYRTGDYTTTRPYRPTNRFFLGHNFTFTTNAGSCGSQEPTMKAWQVRFGRERDLKGAVNRWQ